jgi:Uma2 family endonuclease
MSTATRRTVTLGSDGASPSRGQGPLELMGPFASVPSLEELIRLTQVPDQRVVFRSVDWAFYDRLVDSIPEMSNIHVDYDGRDLEVMGKSRKHGKCTGLLGQLVEAICQELEIEYSTLADTTWKRSVISRGLEADRCYYFLPEKIAADAAALERDSKDIADYPNPDLAIEVDLSPPQIDRAGIYAALRVAEVWRFDGELVVIERLSPDGKYVPVEASGFLPIRTEEVQRWIVEENSQQESSWARRFRAYIRTRAAN